jgi:hypothetical protein
MEGLHLLGAAISTREAFTGMDTIGGARKVAA